jgi:hypothetical protein
MVSNYVTVTFRIEVTVPYLSVYPASGLKTNFTMKL